MNYKKQIIKNIGFTDLVYGRINKKLNLALTNEMIEKLIISVISESKEADFQRIGKNIYISNFERKIKLTINFNSNRIITASVLK